MIEHYEDYLSLSGAITFQEAMEIYNTIVSRLDDSEDGTDLWEEYLQAAVDYAKIRADWLLLSLEEKEESDPRRTALHDRSIISLNILARWMNRFGRDCSWRDRLGDGTWRRSDYDVKKEVFRKRIGDFHCYVALIYGLNAR